MIVHTALRPQPEIHDSNAVLHYARRVAAQSISSRRIVLVEREREREKYFPLHLSNIVKMMRSGVLLSLLRHSNLDLGCFVSVKFALLSRLPTGAHAPLNCAISFFYFGTRSLPVNHVDRVFQRASFYPVY